MLALVCVNGLVDHRVASYSAKLTCRSAAITKASQFQVGGGKGALNVGGRVTFKTMFGFLTATPGGLRGDTPVVTSLEEVCNMFLADRRFDKSFIAFICCCIHLLFESICSTPLVSPARRLVTRRAPASPMA